MGEDESPAATSRDDTFHSQFHSSQLLLNMQQYLRDGKLTDVVLVCGERRIPAHRLVLAAASDYFAAMFTQDLREATQEEIKLVGVNEEALATLVEYCYTGKIELKEETVEDLLSTASIIQLTKVVESASDFLRRQLHPSNCIGIQLFADIQGCKDLLTAAMEYTAENFEQVVGNEEFFTLKPEELGNLLACDDLNVPNEECIFDALLAWVHHDLESRKQHLPALLEHVKLPLLSPEFLTDHVEGNPLFKENRTCNDLVMEAMKYHLLPERRSSMQSPRTRPRKSTVGCLYVVGGSDTSKGCTTMERYSYRANHWCAAEFMVGRRLQFGVAVLQNKLYVVGGRDGLKTLNTVECFDPNTKTWMCLPPMSTHRHGLGTVAI